MATGSTAPRTTAIATTPRFILHDPYSRALSCGRPWGLCGNLPRRSLMTESMIDRPRVDGPRTPLEDTIIYELHVRGYTIDPSSGVRASRAPIRASPRRSTTSKSWGSPPSSFFPSTSSMRTTVRSSIR